MLSLVIQLALITVALCSNSAKEMNMTVCFFESGLCGWINDRSDGSSDDWLSPSAGYWTYGPHQDHSYGVHYGKYISINPTITTLSRATRRATKIISAPFLPDDKYCIQFYYILSGSNADVINVHVEAFGGLGYPILSVHPTVHTDWQYAEKEIDSEYTSINFQIVFESFLSSYRYYIGNFQYGHRNTDMKLAIDDVYITNRACADVPRCPQGSDVARYGDVTSCLFVNLTAVSWNEAVTSCRTLSPFAQLVSIESEDKQNRVVNLLKHTHGAVEAAQHGIWTAGSDTNSEGHWVWTNTQATFNYTDWKVGQPNNVFDRQDCLALDYPTDNYSWGDEYCLDKKPFICEAQYNAAVLDHS